MPLVESYTLREVRAAVLAALTTGLGASEVTQTPPDPMAVEPDTAATAGVAVGILRATYQWPDGRLAAQPVDLGASVDVLVRRYLRAAAGGRGATYDVALDHAQRVAGLIHGAAPGLRVVSTESAIAWAGEWVQVDVTARLVHRTPLGLSS